MYLLLLVGLLAGAMSVTATLRLLNARKIYAIARRLGLQFSRPDRFVLARRVAPLLPIPGAAEVVVRDVAYATTDAGLLCVMTASFTIGTVSHRQQFHRVCAALDPGGKELRHFRMLEGKPSPEHYIKAYEQLVASAKGT